LCRDNNINTAKNFVWNNLQGSTMTEKGKDENLRNTNKKYEFNVPKKKYLAT